MLATVRDRFTPYEWQVHAHLFLAGYQDPQSSLNFGKKTTYTPEKPCRYTLCAANGSGKDSYIGAGVMPWLLCTKPRMKVICTSASASQVFEQTEKPCRNVVDALNGVTGEKRFSYILRTITDVKTRSELRFFATDDPGKAEGNHPFEDYAGAEMAVVMNEVKTIGDNITEAMERNTGFSYWIEYSSPGAPTGHFYDMCQQQGENTRVDVVTAFQCTHISAAEISRRIERHGRQHPLIKSSIFAEFASSVDEALISQAIVDNHECTYLWKDNKLRAGLDLGLGGDEAVLFVYCGPRFVAMDTFHSHNAVELVTYFISRLEKYKVPAENVNADGSGIGKPIISIFNDKGWDVRRVRNDQIPRDKNFYLNKGAEMWDNGKAIIQGGATELPCDAKFLKELITRRSMVVNGKLRLEDKRAARIAGRLSPNRADAWMLTFCNVDRAEMGIAFDKAGKLLAPMPVKPGQIRVADGQVPYELLLKLYHPAQQRPNRFRPKTYFINDNSRYR